MRYTASCGVVALLGVTLVACDAEPAADLESFEGRSSYAIGVNIGQNMMRDGVELDLPSFMRGVQDMLEDREPQLSGEEMGQVFQELQTRLQASQQQRFAEVSERNVTEGQQYLAENGQREGVTTTESGLQYEVLAQGDGPRPSATDQVSVHYRGTLIDGTEFDSSYERGEPATFAAGGVIDGWAEALQLMPVGSKYRLVIPSNLAYGERGAGADIGPNATLIFEVELLEIVTP